MSTPASWSPPYRIISVKTSYDTQCAMTHATLYYETPESVAEGQYLAVNVDVSDESLYDLNEEQVIMSIAELANGNVQGGSAFIIAVREWYLSTQVKKYVSGNWQTIGYTNSEIKFEYNESSDWFFKVALGKKETSALNKKDLEFLPGLGESVKHPPNQDNDFLPDCTERKQEKFLQQMIIHLNDRHRWTREQIADWLDEISDPTGETGPDLRFAT